MSRARSERSFCCTRKWRPCAGPACCWCALALRSFHSVEPMLVLIQTVLFIAASCGIAYSFASLWTTIRFHLRERRRPHRDFTPPVSILKPLCGLDPHGYESLRSHCRQDYPEYEIIFGIATLDDPAASGVE